MKKLLFIWLEIVLDVMNAQKIFVLAAKSSLTMLEEFAISSIKQNVDFVKSRSNSLLLFKKRLLKMCAKKKNALICAKVFVTN